MGADLLLATVAHNKRKKLNWTAGRQVIKKMKAETLLQQASDCWGEAESVTQARRDVNALISDLKAEITNGNAQRDAYVMEVGQWRIYLRGGTSFGDDPSNGYTTISDMQYFPQVLKAIGFDERAIKYV